MKATEDRAADHALRLAAAYEKALKIKKDGDRRTRIDQIEAEARSCGIWRMYLAARDGFVQ